MGNDQSKFVSNVTWSTVKRTFQSDLYRDTLTGIRLDYRTTNAMIEDAAALSRL
jgi:hypothetical protein